MFSRTIKNLWMINYKNEIIIEDVIDKENKHKRI
jgi:hypothetical protein